MRPTISPAMKTARIDEQQHAVQARADAADDDLAELHIDQRNHAAQRREAVVHGVDRAAGGGGGDRRRTARSWRCRSGPPCLPCCRRSRPDARSRSRIAARLRPVGRRQRRPGTARPWRRGSPSPGADRRPCGRRCWSAPRRWRRSRPSARDWRARRVFVRMRGIGVEEAAAVGAEHLDRHLRGHRPVRDGLRCRLPASSPRHRRRGSAARPARPATARGRRRSAAARRSVQRVRSTQKLPIVACWTRAKPRISATARAMPVAAETKFCTVSPAIWVK